MRYSPPLVAGKLHKRYKRFLADVELNNEIVVAHCPNPGSMLGLAEPGTPVWLSPRTAPERKLDWVWELTQLGEHYVGINTMHPNRLVSEAITGGGIPDLAGYGALRREVPYGHNSRVDMVLSHPDKSDCYVEVKNVHLRRQGQGGGLAEFPDSVTKRGTKHLGELAEVAAGGARAVIVFAVQRGDCERFSLAADIDPAFAAGFRQALNRGVEALCYAWTATPDGLALTRRLPIVDNP
jgi:sugar fermentation stimulation protein A